jgi:hypothetical protein
MKPKLLLVFLLLISLARADDQLISIDPTAGMITIQQQGALKTYRLRPFTDITINGVKATAPQLQPGMQVAIGLADPQTASKIAARGNPATAAATPSPARGPATPKPAFSAAPTSQLTRHLVIKASVDAGDNVVVQDGKLHIEHIDWSQPVDISINGIKWKPKWDGNNTDDFTGFNPPLAPFTGANVTIKKLKGRGDATVLEPPTEANGQKLVVHLQDNGSGASPFEVHVTW